MSDILVYYTIDNKAEAEPCPITLTKPNNTLGDLKKKLNSNRTYKFNFLTKVVEDT